MAKRDLIWNIGIIAIAGVTLAFTGVTIKHQFFPTRAVPIATGPVHLSSWRTFAQGGHRFGAPSGAVTIVVFSDFQCPFCAKLTDSLHAVLSRRRDVTIVFHHFPLAIHPFAERAAEASECASLQGGFTAYHDRLFAARDSIGLKPWTVFASEANIADTTALSACISSGAMRDIVDSDIALGKRAAVVATPTVIINGERYNGIPANLDSTVDAAAKSADR